MTDIVERLREGGSDAREGADEIERLRAEYKHLHRLLDEREAEIERLRAVLRYARDVAAGHVDNKCYDCLELMQHIDRELAEGK